MPSGRNWMYFVYVNLAFIIYLLGIYYITKIEEIKKNWVLYRCNPLFMPLSNDINYDFQHCVQDMQANFMGFLLEPLTFLASSLSFSMNGYLFQINSVRGMFNKVRNFLSNIASSIYGVFLNLIIEIQKIIIGIRDLFGKTTGILTTLLFVMDTCLQTMRSVWNGPPGQMVTSLGRCFHPDTKIKLKNGNIVFIKDLNLGDILENNSKVEATMKIDNTKDPEELYVIKN